MEDMRVEVLAQLVRVLTLLHRTSFNGNPRTGGFRNPLRGQGRILAILKLRPEMSQKDLAFMLDMSKQALAELLLKLERSGYITREPSEADRRVSIIRLTETGAAAAEDLADSPASDISGLFDCLDKDELEQFSSYLARIIDSLEAQIPQEEREMRQKAIDKIISCHSHRWFA